MQNSEDYMDISGSIALRESEPFYGNVFDMKDYARVAEECIKAIENSASIRQVVLETWLLVDYAVRELLSALWELKQFNNEGRLSHDTK